MKIGDKLESDKESVCTENTASDEPSKDLKDNKKIEINLDDECGGEPEPGCFSSFAEFKYRAWEFLARWKYIICCQQCKNKVWDMPQGI